MHTSDLSAKRRSRECKKIFAKRICRNNLSIEAVAARPESFGSAYCEGKCARARIGRSLDLGAFPLFQVQSHRLLSELYIWRRRAGCAADGVIWVLSGQPWRRATERTMAESRAERIASFAANIVTLNGAIPAWVLAGVAVVATSASAYALGAAASALTWVLNHEAPSIGVAAGAGLMGFGALAIPYLVVERWRNHGHHFELFCDPSDGPNSLIHVRNTGGAANFYAHATIEETGKRFGARWQGSTDPNQLLDAGREGVLVIAAAITSAMEPNEVQRRAYGLPPGVPYCRAWFPCVEATQDHTAAHFKWNPRKAEDAKRVSIEVTAAYKRGRRITRRITIAVTPLEGCVLGTRSLE